MRQGLLSLAVGVLCLLILPPVDSAGGGKSIKEMGGPERLVLAWQLQSGIKSGESVI